MHGVCTQEDFSPGIGDRRRDGPRWPAPLNHNKPQQPIVCRTNEVFIVKYVSASESCIVAAQHRSSRLRPYLKQTCEISSMLLKCFRHQGKLRWCCVRLVTLSEHFSSPLSKMRANEIKRYSTQAGVSSSASYIQLYNTFHVPCRLIVRQTPCFSTLPDAARRIVQLRSDSRIQNYDQRWPVVSFSLRPPILSRSNDSKRGSALAL